MRAEIIAVYTPLAESIARRFARNSEPLDELCQVALLALVKSLERFDPDLGHRFAAYAQVTISGELKRHFRGAWRLRVPRRVQERYLQVRATIEELSQQLERAPTLAEIAVRAGCSVDDVAEAIEAGRSFRPLSLDAPRSSGSGEARFEPVRVDGGFEEVEDQAVVHGLVSRLPEREQRIVRLRFWEGQSQSQIARQVGVSQMHVSRLLAQSLACLREWADEAPQAAPGS